eukprot:1145520-Pelagomonas_calceolata.AAC.6
MVEYARVSIGGFIYHNACAPIMRFLVPLSYIKWCKLAVALKKIQKVLSIRHPFRKCRQSPPRGLTVQIESGCPAGGAEESIAYLRDAEPPKPCLADPQQLNLSPLGKVTVDEDSLLHPHTARTKLGSGIAHTACRMQCELEPEACWMCFPAPLQLLLSAVHKPLQVGQVAILLRADKLKSALQSCILMHKCAHPVSAHAHPRDA